MVGRAACYCKVDELNADYIIPEPFGPRVGEAVAKAVSDAARKPGVTRI